MRIPTYSDNYFSWANPNADETLHLLPASWFESRWMTAPKRNWGTTKDCDYITPHSVKSLNPFIFGWKNSTLFFKAARVSFSENPTSGIGIHFMDGKHRTRWLLDNHCQRIPVSIHGDLRLKVLEKNNLTQTVINQGSLVDIPIQQAHYKAIIQTLKKEGYIQDKINTNHRSGENK